MQSITMADDFVMQSEEADGLHVAIIMDGNGRWAARRGLPRIAGHRAGATAVHRVVERAPDVGVRCLTLYAFSSDNWRRPPAEVQGIFWLLRAYLRLETEKLKRHGARLEVIGRRDRLPARLLREIEQAERVTSSGRRLHLRVAIDYSSRDALTGVVADAITAMSPRRNYTAGWLKQILMQTLSAGRSDVDLLIRTGGEKRLSDFLLWECAYAELLFTDRMWPDFDETDLEEALNEFHRRERRFGGVPTTPSVSIRDAR